MKNKKSQVPEGILVVLTLIVAVSAIVEVAAYRDVVVSGFSPPSELLNFYDSFDKASFQDKEAARLTISEAYAEVISKPSFLNPEQCRSFGTVPVLEKPCSASNSKTKENFLAAVSKRFEEKTGKKQYSFAFEGDKIMFKSNDLSPKTRLSKESAIFEITHNFNHKFLLGYPPLNVEEVYLLALSRKESCVSEQNFEQCIGGLKASGWKINAETQQQYVLVTLTSDKSYIYGGKFSPVEIKFAAENPQTTIVA